MNDIIIDIKEDNILFNIKNKNGNSNDIISLDEDN